MCIDKQERTGHMGRVFNGAKTLKKGVDATRDRGNSVNNGEDVFFCRHYSIRRCIVESFDLFLFNHSSNVKGAYQDFDDACFDTCACYIFVTI